MPNFCAVIKCGNRGGRDKKSFFRLPVIPSKGSEKKRQLIKERRLKWLSAIKRSDLNEDKTKYIRICQDHFLTGNPADIYDTNHPDWVPSKNLGYEKKNDSSQKMNRYNRVQNRMASERGPSKDSNHPEYVPSVFNFDPPNKTSNNNLKLKEAALCILSNNHETNTDVNFESYHTIENNGSKDAEELLSLKLELNGAFTDINTLRKENDTLIKQLSTAEEIQNILRKAISGKEEELMKVKKELLTVSEKEKELVKVKKELEQAYTEISALRMKKENLQKQLISSDITQSILQDPYKLNFYTGLNNWKDFNLILSFLSKVENRIRSIPLETQLLIVLTKLKLNLLNVDLAYRFKTSHKTVGRIFNHIIPPLQTKIDLLVKSPVNTALRKNLSVYFKNTVYDNLHQRLTKYSKSQMKHLDNEEEESDSDIL